MYSFDIKRHCQKHQPILAVIKHHGHTKYITLRNDKKGYSGIDLKKGCIEPIITDIMSRIFVTGETGSGKSSLIAKFINNRYYLDKENGEKTIPSYILSAKKDDPAYDHLKKAYQINEKELLDNPIKNLKELRNTTVIFDDISYPNERVNKIFQQWRDRLLSLGRQHKINVISTSWIMKNWYGSRYPLTQSQAIVFFPAFDKRHVVEYLKQRGFKANDVHHQLKKIHSRWAILYKNPPILITDKEVKILHPE
jgi:hypothetical protein